MTKTVKEVMEMLARWGDLDGSRKVVIASRTKPIECYNDEPVRSVQWNSKRIVLTLM